MIALWRITVLIRARSRRERDGARDHRAQGNPEFPESGRFMQHVTPPCGTSWSRPPGPARKTWRSRAVLSAPLAHDAVQHEHHRARRHVAIIVQHRARGAERRRAAEPKACSTASSTVRPPGCTAHRSISLAPPNMSSRDADQRGADGARHRAGQHHVEALLADMPADQLARVAAPARRGRTSSPRLPGRR